jgi:hypothetical protein
VPTSNGLPEGPERHDAHCAPCSYGNVVDSADESVEGDGDGLAVGGGVRRGFSVGMGVGVGVGSADGVGSGVGTGDAVSVGVGDGSGVGSAVGSTDGDGVMSITAGVGVARFGGTVGAAVSAGVGAGVGVTSGLTVPLGPNTWAVCAMKPEAAKTKTPPRRATATIVTTSVPVVRIAPRMTCAGRSASQERRSCRRRRAAIAARMIRSSRSADADGSGCVASNPISRVVPPSSAEHAGHSRRCSASWRRPPWASSSSRYALISGRAASQSRGSGAEIWLTPHT